MNVQLIVAQTLYGMAWRDGLDIMGAYANVIANRVRKSEQRSHWWGVGWIEVCRRPGQFHCWNPHSAMLHELQTVNEGNPRFREALMFAREAINGDLPDRTKGCDYIHPLTVQIASIMPEHLRQIIVPTPRFVMGRHKLYKLES